jgi:hypothetical protein
MISLSQTTARTRRHGSHRPPCWHSAGTSRFRRIAAAFPTRSAHRDGWRIPGQSPSTSCGQVLSYPAAPHRDPQSAGKYPINFKDSASNALCRIERCRRLRSAGVRLNPGLCLRADVGGHHKPGIRRRSSDAASLARHGSSMRQGKVSMVKTRLTRWISRWRERRLAREQTRQTSAARQATRDTERQRYHSTGHGP